MADDLQIPFIFVQHGDPPPLEWMRQHPNWIKIPALFVAHGTDEAVRREMIADFYAGRRFRAPDGDELSRDFVPLSVADEERPSDPLPLRQRYQDVPAARARCLTGGSSLFSGTICVINQILSQDG